MWSSSGRNNNSNNNNNNNSSPSPSKSKSSSTCSSPSPFSPSSPNKTTMEEVWRDISLSSLHDHSSTTITTTTNGNNSHSNFPSLILQDFLARPFNKDSPTKRASAEPSSVGHITSFGSLKSPIATMLSLNSGSDFQYPETGATDPTRPNQHIQSHPSIGACSFGCTHNTAFDAIGSPSVFPSFCKKRPQDNDDNSDDRRHKRMIKNRESAARSRARKQAYTNELELEVAHLVEENAKLRRQQEKLLAASAQLPKKRRLYRTSTAPF